MRLRIAAILVIVSAFLGASRHFVVDDGLIYARYIQNALNGTGLVFNQGEAVNSLTSPFFTYILLMMSWLFHGHILFAEHFVFGVMLVAACVLAEQIIPYSGIAVATTGYFYFLIGLESSLFLLMLMLVVKAFVDKKYDWLPLLLVLALLTRFESGLLVLIIGFQLWRERKSPRPLSYLPAVLILFVYFSLNLHWYGRILPNSASSKFGQAMSGYWGRWPTAFLRVRGWMFGRGFGAFRWTAYMVPLFLIFGYFGWRALKGTRTDAIIMPFCVTLTSFCILANIPSYHWYYAPLIFFIILYAVKGVPATGRAHGLLAAVLVISGVSNLVWVNRMGPPSDYVNVAEWINTHTATSATVESVEIGQIGWSTHRHLIDILGLTYPRNAEHIAHRDPSSWLLEDRPDYIIVHRPLWVYEEITRRFPEYQPVPYHSGSVYILYKTAPLPK